MDVTFLKNLRVLVIFYSAIRTADLTQLEFLELVVCGFIYNISNGMQIVTVRPGVVKKVYDVNIK